MKDNLLKWYMFAFVLLCGFTAFAQETDSPGDDCTDPTGEDCDLEGTSPIDNKIFYLGGAALVLSYAFYSRNKKINAN